MAGVTKEGILQTTTGGGGASTTVAIGQPINATDAAVLNTAPTGTEYGVAVRLVGASGGGGPATIADGADVTQGAIADAAVVTDTGGTLSGKLRGLVKWAFERMPASLGQKVMTGSLPVVIASDQSAVAVSGPLTDTQLRATPVDVIGPLTDTQLRATPVPVSAAALPLPAGAATAALQTTGNASLANIDADLDVALSTRLAEATFTNRINTQGQKNMAGSTPVVLASDQSSVPVTAAQGTAAASTAGWPVNIGGSAAFGNTTWTSATPLNTALTINCAGYGTCSFLLNVTSILTNMVIRLEGSPDGGTTYTRISGKRYSNAAQGNAPTITSAPIDNGSATGTFVFTVDTAGLTNIRLIVATVTGAGSITINGVLSARAVTSDIQVTRLFGGNYNSLLTNTPIAVTSTTDGAKERLDVVASSKIDLTPSAPAAVSVGVASGLALAANANRKGCILTNTSNAIISLAFGANPAVLNSGITLLPFGVFYMDEYSFDTGDVNAIASAAASNLAIQEFA